eukprot:scaffold108347_cov28-Tisochrysis_lutea.AAC.1
MILYFSDPSGREVRAPQRARYKLDIGERDKRVQGHLSLEGEDYLVKREKKDSLPLFSKRPGCMERELDFPPTHEEKGKRGGAGDGERGKEVRQGRKKDGIRGE